MALCGGDSCGPRFLVTRGCFPLRLNRILPRIAGANCEPHPRGRRWDECRKDALICNVNRCGRLFLIFRAITAHEAVINKFHCFLLPRPPLLHPPLYICMLRGRHVCADGERLICVEDFDNCARTLTDISTIALSCVRLETSNSICSCRRRRRVHYHFRLTRSHTRERNVSSCN